MTANDTDDLHVLSIYETAFWFAIYGLIALLAIGGNIMIIFILFVRFKTHTATTYFIINLAIAELLTGLIAIPFKFQSARLQSWELPHFMCSVLPFIETLSLSVSVFTLTASALDRFCAIKFPNLSTESVARNTILSIWLFSMGCSLPYGIFHQVYAFDVHTYALISDVRKWNGTAFVWQCLPIYFDQSWWKAYNVYLTIVQYFVPVIILDTVYAIIGYHMWTAEPLPAQSAMRDSFERNKRVVLKLMVIVATVFTLCWLPYETYLLLCEFYPEINDFYYINVVFFGFHWLAMSNSCLNPIIYGCYNEKIQREYKRLMLPALRTICCAKFENVVIEETTLAQSEPNSPGPILPEFEMNRNSKMSVTINHYIACELGKDHSTSV